MGLPAARLGDVTAHGGALTSGNPTVLIGGQPAATMGDFHVCPMCSPGPHVGGPVLGGAPTVLIGGKPAARVGDMCTCSAPAPDVILTGAPTVLIGGARGASSGAAAAAASAHGATAAPGTPGLGAVADPVPPWVGAGYMDKAGRPVTGWHYRADGDRQRDGQLGTGGQVWLDALAGSGSVEVGLVGVYGCRWERDEARVGQEVALSARCVGVEGEAAVFEVWRETLGPDGRARRVKVWETPGTAAGDTVRADAPFAFALPPGGVEEAPRVARAPVPTPPPEGEPETSAEGGATDEVGAADEAPVSSVPVLGVEESVDDGGLGGDDWTAIRSLSFWADIVVGGRYRASSGPLRFQDEVAVSTETADGEPLGGVEFEVTTSAGGVLTGTTASDGTATIRPVPPGPYSVTLVRVPTPPSDG